MAKYRVTIWNTKEIYNELEPLKFNNKIISIFVTLQCDINSINQIEVGKRNPIIIWMSSPARYKANAPKFALYPKMLQHDLKNSFGKYKHKYIHIHWTFTTRIFKPPGQSK